MLANLGEITKKPRTELLVAVSLKGKIAEAVDNFSDMSSYGSGGSATTEKNASGFRLLAVDQAARDLGVGKVLPRPASLGRTITHKSLYIPLIVCSLPGGI